MQDVLGLYLFQSETKDVMRSVSRKGPASGFEITRLSDAG